MTIVVDLQDRSGGAALPNIEAFERWVAASLRDAPAALEQTICVVDEVEGRELNRQFRGKDNPTNVLAFPAEDEFLDYACLGDLVLCAPVVLREAREQGKPEEAHWAHLVVHGMLHLQGFDHIDSSAAVEMEAAEIEILDTLGYTNPYNGWLNDS